MNIDPFKRYVPELDPDNQERVYTKVSYDGASCIMEPREAEAMAINASIDEECEYVLTEVRMTPAQFEKLHDFGGF